MLYSAKVNSRGVVTIPVEIRKNMGIEPNSEVIFIQDGNQYVLKVVPPITRLRDFFRDKKDLSDDEINQVRQRVWQA